MLSKRFQTLKPSPVLSLVAKAKQYKAEGRDVINASIGQPAWECFDSIQKKAIEAIKKGASGYSPASGHMQLRKEIIADVNKHLDQNYTTDNVTVSIGAKFMCFGAIQALVDPGMEVIIPAPYWVSYPSMVELSGGIPVIVPGDEKTQKLTPEGLKKYLNQNTKVLFFNSPNNPTGAVYSVDELKAIGECLREWTNVYIISDDIYNRIYLDGEPGSYAPHILEVCPFLKDRVIIINAASKNYAMPGWRVGWAVAEASLIKAMTSYQSQTVSCAPTVAQLAMLSSFVECEEDIKKVHKLLSDRRDKVCQLISEIKEIKFQKPEGAFYLWLDIRGFYGSKYRDKNINSSMDFCEFFSEDQSVFTVPGEAFGKPGYLRYNFSISDQDIEKSVQRLQIFISALSR